MQASVQLLQPFEDPKRLSFDLVVETHSRDLRTYFPREARSFLGLQRKCPQEVMIKINGKAVLLVHILQPSSRLCRIEGERAIYIYIGGAFTDVNRCARSWGRKNIRMHHGTPHCKLNLPRRGSCRRVSKFHTAPASSGHILR